MSENTSSDLSQSGKPINKVNNQFSTNQKYIIFSKRRNFYNNLNITDIKNNRDVNMNRYGYAPGEHDKFKTQNEKDNYEEKQLNMCMSQFANYIKQNEEGLFLFKINYGWDVTPKKYENGIIPIASEDILPNDTIITEVNNGCFDGFVIKEASTNSGGKKSRKLTKNKTKKNKLKKRKLSKNRKYKY